LTYILLVSTLAPVCSAVADDQPSSADRVLAETLFRKGKQLMEQGKFESACASFTDSLRLEPNIATQYQLAACNERLGKLATAWQTYLDTARMARADGDTKREQFAMDKANALEPKVPRLIIAVGAAGRLPGLTIQLNQRPLPEAAWGTELLQDPGEYRVLAQAPGYQNWQKQVTLIAGAKPVRVLVPALTPTAKPTPVEPPPALTPLPTPAPTIPADVGQEGRSAWFWAGLGSTIGGTALAVVGTVLWVGSVADGNERTEQIEADQDRSLQQCVNTAPAGTPCTGTSDLQPLTLSPTGPALVAAGGALALTGVVLMVMFSDGDGSSDPPEQALRVRPLLGLGYGAVALSF